MPEGGGTKGDLPGCPGGSGSPSQKQDQLVDLFERDHKRRPCELAPCCIERTSDLISSRSSRAAGCTASSILVSAGKSERSKDAGVAARAVLPGTWPASRWTGLGLQLRRAGWSAQSCHGEAEQGEHTDHGGASRDRQRRRYGKHGYFAAFRSSLQECHVMGEKHGPVPRDRGLRVSVPSGRAS